MNPTPHSGFLDSVKETIRWDVIKEKFYAFQPTLIEIGLFGGAGFVIGFLLKKFGKIIAFLIAAVVILGILHQLNIISISLNWAKIQEIFGIQSSSLDNAAITSYGDWIKNHLLQVLFFVIGFVLGIHFA